MLDERHPLAPLLPRPQRRGAAEHEAVDQGTACQRGQDHHHLATIKDEEASKEAHPLLKQAAKEWAAIRKKAEDLPAPSPARKNKKNSRRSLKPR